MVRPALRLIAALVFAAIVFAAGEARAETAVVLEVDGPAGRVVRRAALTGVSQVADVANAAHARAVARRLGVQLNDVAGCAALARELDAAFVLLGAVQGSRVALAWIGPSGPLTTRAARLPRGARATRRFSAMIEATSREVLAARASAPAAQASSSQITDDDALRNVENRLSGRGNARAPAPTPTPTTNAPTERRRAAAGDPQTLNEVDALIASLDGPPQRRPARETPAPTPPTRTTASTTPPGASSDPRIRAVQNETSRQEESRQERAERMAAERAAMEAERRERAERDRLELRVQERDRALARREAELHALQERVQRQERERREAQERAAAAQRAEQERRAEAEHRREEQARREREAREERARREAEARRERDDDRYAERDRYEDERPSDRYEEDRREERYEEDRRDEERREEDRRAEEDTNDRYAADTDDRDRDAAPSPNGLPPEEYYELLEEHYELLEEREDEEEDQVEDRMERVDDRRDEMVGDDLDDFLEDDEAGGHGEVPPTLELLAGFGMRARTSDVFRADGSGERVSTGLFPELTFDVRFRPFASDGTLLSFLYAELEGAFGLGASTQRQTAEQPISTFPYRGRALVGFTQSVWLLELGARAGFGLEGYSVDSASPLTSASYAYLLVAGHVRVAILEDVLGVKLGAGIRPVFAARGLDPAAAQGSTAFGFEFSLGVNGVIADRFLYDVAFNYQRYSLGFGAAPAGITTPALTSGYDLGNGVLAQGGIQF